MIQLVITLDATGQVRVSGPLTNAVLCCGLLEVAKKTILERHKPGLIQLPTLRPPDCSNGPEPQAG